MSCYILPALEARIPDQYRLVMHTMVADRSKKGRMHLAMHLTEMGEGRETRSSTLNSGRCFHLRIDLC